MSHFYNEFLNNKPKRSDLDLSIDDKIYLKFY